MQQHYHYQSLWVGVNRIEIKSINRIEIKNASIFSFEYVRNYYALLHYQLQ